MKILAAILSIYILFLAFSPCMDGDTIAQKEKHKTETKKHTHQESEDDACSPFCICSCCGLQILNFSQPVVFAPTPVFHAIKSHTPNYNSIFAPSFYGNIWQPPQLS